MAESLRVDTTLPISPQRLYASWLEVLIEETDAGSHLTLVHTNIPEGQAKQYEQGWREYYFKPMLAYFSEGA